MKPFYLHPFLLRFWCRASRGSLYRSWPDLKHICQNCPSTKPALLFPLDCWHCAATSANKPCWRCCWSTYHSLQKGGGSIERVSCWVRIDGRTGWRHTHTHIREAPETGKNITECRKYCTTSFITEISRLFGSRPPLAIPPFWISLIVLPPVRFWWPSIPNGQSCALRLLRV